MLPTKTFRESPFKALKILGIILGVIFLFFAFVAFSDDMPRMTADGLNKQAFLLVILTTIFGGVMLLTFLILSFQTRKIIKCDFEGCKVLQANFWQTNGFSDHFKWNNVTDTNIVEKLINLRGEGAVSIYSLVAETNKGQIDLLDLKTSTQSNIEGLIDYVNKATPHSKYVWIKDKNSENPTAIDSVYGFSKVARKD